MKFGRILRDSPDGKIARLVVVEPEKGRVIDLARAAALHYVTKRHATAAAARTLQTRHSPAAWPRRSRWAITLTDHAPEIGAARGDDAELV